MILFFFHWDEKGNQTQNINCLSEEHPLETPCENLTLKIYIFPNFHYVFITLMDWYVNHKNAHTNNSIELELNSAQMSFGVKPIPGKKKMVCLCFGRHESYRMIVGLNIEYMCHGWVCRESSVVQISYLQQDFRLDISSIRLNDH